MRTLRTIICAALLAAGCSDIQPILTGNVLNGSSLKSFLNNDTSQQKNAPHIIGIESEIPEILHKFAQGSSVSIDGIMADDVDGDDAILAYFERGRIAQLNGDPIRSIKEFEFAIARIKELEERAKISLSDSGAHGTALIVNDKMIPYEPAGFEKVLIYHFQALNYLMHGDLEAAGVEVRRANAEQVSALQAHEEEIARAENLAKSEKLSTKSFANDARKILGTSAKIGDTVKSSFQNAYTFYTSAVVHELMHEPGDAYIDYKKALEIAPSNSFIARDVVRLATELGRRDEIRHYSKRYPRILDPNAQIAENEIEAVILFEDGLVPEKTPLSFLIPIPLSKAPGVTSIAIPTYRASPAEIKPLIVRQGSTILGHSETICSIDALAIKAFEEEAPAMLVRQMIRASLKGVASTMASKHGNKLVSSIVSLIATATEQADTRSWKSLPGNAQVLRIRVARGSTIELIHPLSGMHSSVNVPTEGGNILLIRAARIGSRLFAQSVEL